MTEQRPDIGGDAAGDVSGDAAGLTGNRARDHLANERTYLSWLRTSLGVLALAAAVARFGVGGGGKDAVAVALLGVLGVLVLVVGTRRYYQVQGDLERGRFSFSRWTPMVVGIVVVAVAVVLLPLLL
jgi:putative membrane protein